MKLIAEYNDSDITTYITEDKKGNKFSHFLALIDLDVGVLKDIKHLNLVMGG